MTQYLPFLAILAPFALFYNQSKAAVVKIISFFWKTQTLEAPLCYEFYNLLLKYPKCDFGNFTPKMHWAYNLKSRKTQCVIGKHISKQIVFYKYLIPVFISNYDPYGSYGPWSNGNANKPDIIKINYFNFSFPFLKLLQKVLFNLKKDSEKQDSHFYIKEIRGNRGSRTEDGKTDAKAVSKNGNSITNGSIFSYGYNWYQRRLGALFWEKIEDFRLTKPLDCENKYVMTTQGRKIFKQVEKWTSLRDWYTERSIRFYRGTLLHSPPGTGKSALIAEIAKKLQLPLFIVDLSSLNNEQLLGEIKKCEAEMGILLFEDFDCTFHKRENLTKTDIDLGVTFDCFINLLSGVDAINNKFVFITTNDISKIDDAILRPGRCDEIVRLENLTLDEKKYVAKAIVDDSECIDILVEQGKNDTTAEFENRCVSYALDNLWKKQ